MLWSSNHQRNFIHKKPKLYFYTIPVQEIIRNYWTINLKNGNVKIYAFYFSNQNIENKNIYAQRQLLQTIESILRFFQNNQMHQEVLKTNVLINLIYETALSCNQILTVRIQPTVTKQSNTLGYVRNTNIKYWKI